MIGIIGARPCSPRRVIGIVCDAGRSRAALRAPAFPPVVVTITDDAITNLPPADFFTIETDSVAGHIGFELRCAK